MPADFKDLQATSNISDYKWLSKKLKTAQQQQAVRPFYECRIVDDSIVGDVLSTPNNPLQGSVCVAPDGNMFAVGLDSSNNVAVWKGDTSALSGAPTSILENNASNRNALNHYSIACSDWINGSYKIDIYFFGSWASSYLTISHYYSMDKGATWHTDQVVNTTNIGAYYVALGKSIWLSAGKPYQNDAGSIISTVFYIEHQLQNTTSFKIVHQQYLGSGGTYHIAVDWSQEIDTNDWTIHSLDTAYIDGYFYVVFSGFRQVFDGVNQNSKILNHNIYISKIVFFSNDVDGGGLSKTVWTPIEQVMTSISTSTQNENDFIYPSLFYDDKYLWVIFQGKTVSSIQNNNGSTNVVTDIKYFLAKSSDFFNFNYPVPIVLSGAIFTDSPFYSFFLQGGFYWIAGGGSLGKFIINNIVADVSNDILSYEAKDIQQNPSTISMNIGNANGKWRGANPTQSGYQAINNNKKIALFQGYYNADGVTESAPKNNYFIDDIQQNILVNRNDFNIMGRDFYKHLKVLKTSFAYNYTCIRKYVDLFDRTTLGNWNFLTGTWDEVLGASGISNKLSQTSTSGDTVAVFSLYPQIKANTTFSVSMTLMNPSNVAGSPVYIYFYYINSTNYMRLLVDSNHDGSNYQYKVQSVIAGVSTDIASGIFASGGNITFPFLFVRHNYFKCSIYVGSGANSGLSIGAYSSLVTLATDVDFALTMSTTFLLTGLGSIAFGSLNQTVDFYNFKYLEFDSSLNVIDLLKKIATKSGIFDYKIPTIFEDYFFNNTNYSGSYNIPNRILTIGQNQTVMKNDLQITDSEVEFDIQVSNTTAMQFDIIFRNTGLVNQNENYFFQFLLNSSSNLLTISLYNTHLGTSYNMGSSVSVYIDSTKYHKYKISFVSGYIFLSIDGVVVFGWYDNNVTTIQTTGYIGFRTYSNIILKVRSVVGYELFNQIESFSINPGDDLENSIESLLNITKAYFFSDLLGRLKVVKLKSTDASTYTYQDQITNQQVDNSDKEYVNRVTVIGTNVQAVVDDATSINDNAIVREEIIVDYKIVTYKDALDRANLELVNFNKFNNQYSPRSIVNVGSEIYDVVTVINTGDNSSNVNQTVRNYSQVVTVGGNKLNYWQSINTGKL